jgi:hypothetical protein
MISSRDFFSGMGVRIFMQEWRMTKPYWPKNDEIQMTNGRADAEISFGIRHTSF